MKANRIPCLLVLSAAGALAARDLTVTVTGLRHERGQVLVGVSFTKAAFPEHPERSAIAVIDPATRAATATFADVPEPIVAVSVVHDENANGKLDKSFVGAPAEPVGFSNRARAFLGPPSFAAARIELADGANSLAISIGATK